MVEGTWMLWVVSVDEVRGLSLAGGDGSNHPAWWSSEVRRMELVLKLQYLGQLMATNVGQCSLVSQQKKLEDYAEILTAKLDPQANAGVERRG